MKIQYTVVLTLNQLNLNWTDTFCVIQKKTKCTQLLKTKFNVLDHSTVCYDLSRLDKHGSSYRG